MVKRRRTQVRHFDERWVRCFDDILSHPHPPIKGVHARLAVKNVSMSVRLRNAQRRRYQKQLTRELAERLELFETRGPKEVTVL